MAEDRHGARRHDAAGVVLAAGRSSRAGCIKALARIDGKPLVARTVRALRDGGCAEVLVVVGPPHAEAIARVVPDARRVDNPDPSRGMLSSLQEALRVLAPAARGHVVVALVDQPRVSPAIVRQLLEVLSREEVDAAVPRHAGRGGHPYALARSALAPLLAAPPSASTRDVLAQLRRASVEVDDSSILEDLDTADALRAAHAEFEEREAR